MVLWDRAKIPLALAKHKSANDPLCQQLQEERKILFINVALEGSSIFPVCTIIGGSSGAIFDGLKCQSRSPHSSILNILYGWLAGWLSYPEHNGTSVIVHNIYWSLRISWIPTPIQYSCEQCFGST